MKKVFIVTNSLSGGGAERAMNLVCTELSEALKNEIEITLVPINKGPKDLVEPNCRVVPIDRKWRGSFTDTLLSYLRFTFLIVHEKPKILILNCALPELFACLLPISVSYIVVEHSRNPWLGREVFGRLVRQILKLRQTKFVTVSEHLDIWSLTEMTKEIIPNPVFQTVFRSRSEIQIKRLVFIGRLSTDKNPHSFIEISSATKIPGLVIGDGILMEDLRNLAVKESAKISFIGHKMEPWKLFEDGDLLIVPSKFEGDGLVVAEAILGGFPLLLSDIEEFRKFQLSNSSYCDSTETFKRTIAEFSENIGGLVPSSNSVELLKSERGLSVISNSWGRLIRSTAKI